MSVEAPSPLSTAAGWRLEHSYAQLPPLLYTEVQPSEVKSPRLVILNRPLAAALGLDSDVLSGTEGAEIFAGNKVPPGARPIAQAYAGHQYGHFTVLGDGRAILLGEQLTPAGARFDIQLKGSGPTPYSRRGDGRAALGPMLREYIISESMQALGIPTTRSLAVAATGEQVWRQTPEPGAVLTRVAASHIRVGTFEWAAANRDEAALRGLVDYTLRRHYPDRVHMENSALALLTGVIERQAALIAQWMLVGFVHGVMNTDNMALSGETIDYGPCAFVDAYDPRTVFSSIDEHGRYAYGNQPAIAQWNLTRFAETLAPLLHPDQNTAEALAIEAIEGFGPLFIKHWQMGTRRKLGLFNEKPEDQDLVNALLAWMHKTKADFTNTFAALAQSNDGAACACETDTEFAQWRERWQARLARQPQSAAESMQLRRSSSPAVIPRNHLVERALGEAEKGDIKPMEQLLAVVAQPYAHGSHPEEYRTPAGGAEPYRTYCGT